MKRFRFVFQTLHGVKKLLERQAQGELALIEARRQRCLMERMELDQRLTQETEAFSQKAREGVSVPELQNHGNFLVFMQDAIAEVDARIEVIEKEKRVCQDKLVALMKEIKALENLRDAHFQRYLAEVQKEEELELADFVNFQIIAS